MAVPTWPGAAAVYGRAYRRLEAMAQGGHVAPHARGRRIVGCTASAEMRALIDALNGGDEEQIKGLLLQHETREFYELEFSRRREGR